jgi:hypothetical protein
MQHARNRAPRRRSEQAKSPQYLILGVSDYHFERYVVPETYFVQSALFQPSSTGAVDLQSFQVAFFLGQHFIALQPSLLGRSSKGYACMRANRHLSK